ncbi:MAG: sulfotransferase [Desulfohalobiaceae bacterium]|nr:sulfotransferase [Desulfohalobiaceae bacterium]
MDELKAGDLPSKAESIAHIDPFFIVGVGRSGTSLLMAMLNAHPQITLPPETHFLRRYANVKAPGSLDEAKRILDKDQYIQRLGLDLDAVFEVLDSGKRPLSWVNCYRLLLGTYRARTGKSVIGDKDPKAIEYLPFLHSLFPGASILHLIRDPRDVFLSRLRAEWSRGRSRLSHLLAYRAQFRQGRSHGLSLFGSSYKEIQYEQLLAHPQGVLQEVTAFLGVEYRSEMLHFKEAASSIISPDEASWKQNITGPLLPNNVGKWRKELTSREVSSIEGACSLVFDEGLYARSEKAKSWLQGFRCRCTAFIVGLAEFLYLKWRKIINWHAKKMATNS